METDVTHACVQELKEFVRLVLDELAVACRSRIYKYLS